MGALLIPVLTWSSSSSNICSKTKQLRGQLLVLFRREKKTVLIKIEQQRPASPAGTSQEAVRHPNGCGRRLRILPGRYGWRMRISILRSSSSKVLIYQLGAGIGARTRMCEFN